MQFQCIPAFHRAIAAATARLAADAMAMDDAFRCRPLQDVVSLPGAPSGLCVRQSRPSDFIRCESGHTGPVGASSWLCERTQPVRCRSLNAAARSQPHCRHRQRPSRLSIRTLSGVSRSMAVTTLIGNFVGGNLAAAVSGRERNDGRAISRDQAPATIEFPTSLAATVAASAAL
jgi:hypothetical protein